MNIKMPRETVYQLIDGERAYQAVRWNEKTTTSAGNHSMGEWFTYIADYTQEALHILSREAAPACDEKAKHIMRKVAALAVAAMENQGSFPREPIA